jgi:hypothetical protein
MSATIPSFPCRWPAVIRRHNRGLQESRPYSHNALPPLRLLSSGKHLCESLECSDVGINRLATDAPGDEYFIEGPAP